VAAGGNAPAREHSRRRGLRTTIWRCLAGSVVCAACRFGPVVGTTSEHSRTSTAV
ncbi:MAG: hypothetical protein AVDCRST_MAG26-4629, partial [uncultured Chloroflexia bacterium]